MEKGHRYNDIHQENSDRLSAQKKKSFDLYLLLKVIRIARHLKVYF